MQFPCLKMRYSIEPRDRVYVKRHGLLSFAKNVSRNLSKEYGQKLDKAKKFTTDAMRIASKRAIQKTAEATGDLIGNKIADKITSVLKKYSAKLRSTDLHSKNGDANSKIEMPK